MTILQQNKTRDATFAKSFEEVTYTYRLRAKGAAKELRVTVQSSPLIPDGEFTLYFRRFRVVKKVVGQSYAFYHQIGSGLRRNILFLNEDIEEKDIPSFMTTSDDIRRKLFFQWKVFYSGRYHSKHTFYEGCASEQEDEEQQHPTKQNENRKQ